MLKRPPSVRNAEKQRACKREQMRRWRELKRKAGGVAYAPYDTDVINLLIECNLLDPELADDRHAIGRAYYLAVIDAAREAAAARRR